MQSVRLAQVAAQAELLRLRRYGRRQMRRAVLAAVAMVFLLACLAALHAVGYIALRLVVRPLIAAAIIAAVDLLLGLIFALLAARDTPGRLEREALAVRQTAQQQMLEAAAVTAVLGPLLRLFGVRKPYGLVLAALMAWYLGGRR